MWAGREFTASSVSVSIRFSQPIRSLDMIRTLIQFLQLLFQPLANILVYLRKHFCLKSALIQRPPDSSQESNLLIVSCWTCGSAFPTLPARLSMKIPSTSCLRKMSQSCFGCSKSSSVTGDVYTWTLACAQSSCATSAARGTEQILRKEERTAQRSASIG